MMNKSYRHILVPLDGSPLAEAALVEAFHIAHLSQAKVTLLRVVVPLEGVMSTYIQPPYHVQQYLAGLMDLAWCYLSDLGQRVYPTTVSLRPAVEVGPAAATILDYARQNNVDLIVMATHGRSGLSRWACGSVTSQVLSEADMPVLLMRGQPEKEATLADGVGKIFV
jgi:nucleotide-binding universal stress UspA family protein